MMMADWKVWKMAASSAEELVGTSVEKWAASLAAQMVGDSASPLAASLDTAWAAQLAVHLALQKVGQSVERKVYWRVVKMEPLSAEPKAANWVWKKVVMKVPASVVLMADRTVETKVDQLAAMTVGRTAETWAGVKVVQ